MTLVALVSAKGSPGTSLTAAALAMCWPRPATLAELDPAGSDLRWRNRAITGDPLDPDNGLLSLAAAVRRGAADADLSEHLQRTALGVDALVGITSPDQLAGLGTAWGQLPALFAQHATDVIADCGRFIPGTSAGPVISGADQLVFVARSDVASVAHLRERLRSLHSSSLSGARSVGVVVVAPYRDQRAVGDVEQLLRSDGLPFPVLGAIAEDDKGSRILAGERTGVFAKTLLGRSAREVAGRLAEPATAGVGRR